MILFVANTERVRDVSGEPWCAKLREAGNRAEIVSPKDLANVKPPQDFMIPLTDCFDYEFYLRRVGSSKTRPCSSTFEDALRFAWGVESTIERLGVTGVVTIGSASYRTRAAIQAANRRGIPVCCGEWGILSKKAEFGSVSDAILTRNEAYYALHPTKAFIDFLATWDGFNPSRIEEYIGRWVAAKSTKHQLDISYAKGLPVRWKKGEDSVYFGQLYDDAAMFYGVDHLALAKALHPLSHSGTFLKSHPRDTTADDTTFNGVGLIKWGENTLSKGISIHRVFEGQPKEVIVITSGVGVEAMLYDLPLRILGNPLYSAGVGSREQTLRYLDYLVTHLHVDPTSAKDLSDGVNAVLTGNQPFSF